jgi:hypothetical protein
MLAADTRAHRCAARAVIVLSRYRRSTERPLLRHSAPGCLYQMLRRAARPHSAMAPHGASGYGCSPVRRQRWVELHGNEPCGPDCACFAHQLTPIDESLDISACSRCPFRFGHAVERLRRSSAAVAGPVRRTDWESVRRWSSGFVSSFVSRLNRLILANPSHASFRGAR